MSWTVCAFDTRDPDILGTIDIPNFSWSITLGSSSLRTTVDGGSSYEGSGIYLPWSGVEPRYLQAYISSLALCWDDRPVVAGAVGDRTDTLAGTEFDLVSIYDLLDERYAVTGPYEDEYDWDDPPTQGLHYTHGLGLYNIEAKDTTPRGALSVFGRACTEEKAGGSLNIYWNYVNEDGDEDFDTEADELASMSWKSLFEEYFNGEKEYDSDEEQENGVTYTPEATLRPMREDISAANGGGWRLYYEFIAGTDDEPSIGTDTGITIYMANLADMEVQHLSPYHRIMQIGPSESAQYGDDDDDDDEEEEDTEYFKTWRQDLEPVLDGPEFPLREYYVNTSGTAYQASSAGTYVAWLHNRSQFWLDLESVPIVQITVTVPCSVIKPGEVWPGDAVTLRVRDFPSLPDDDYELRIEEMSGDQTDMVQVTFGVIEDPSWGTY